VYFYLQEYKLLSKYQFGFSFRPRSSTSYAVESIYFNLLSSADTGLYSCSIFLDLSKAFDTVNHNILFDKFYHNFGIRGIPLQLFRSYLSNRKQLIKLENVQSGLVNISNGVPQGSVLGPLLFIMYINDLPKSSAFYTVLYADDTYLCLFHKNFDNLQHMVNVELIKIDNWLRSNKLSLNYSKSTLMLTKSLKNNRNLSEVCSFQIKINDSWFQRTTRANYLRVLIDSLLDWSSHVEYLKSKLVRAPYLFYKIRNVVSVDVLKMLYFSLVHCHLKYCICFMGHRY